MVKKIKFKIDSEGKVQLEVEGAQGAECEAMTSPFEQRLGIVAEKTYKDAFYQEQGTAGSAKDQVGLTDG